MNLFSLITELKVSLALNWCTNGSVLYIALKEKLSHIPDQIRDRSKFLRIIRDVATSIKEVLDAVNEVSKRHQADHTMKEYRKVRICPFNSQSYSDEMIFVGAG